MVFSNSSDQHSEHLLPKFCRKSLVDMILDIQCPVKCDSHKRVTQVIKRQIDISFTAQDVTLCALKNGGGAFFLTCEDFGRMFEKSFPACIFLKWRLG